MRRVLPPLIICAATAAIVVWMSTWDAAGWRAFGDGFRAFWGVRPARSAPAIVLASIYGPHDSGGQISSTGKRIDPRDLTCAHRDLPFGTRLILHHGSNTAEIVIADRGPFVVGRHLDCTPAVDRALHLGGLGRVRVEPFPPLPKPRPSTAN